MKTTKLFLLLFGINFFTICSVNAQKITEGDESLSFLAGEKSLNLEFNYDNMLVGKISEEDYKKEKIAKFNAKQPGKGERWAEIWVNNRATTYEPAFEDLCSKIFFKAKSDVIVARKQPNAKYTLLVKTLMTEPGFNAVVMKQNPFCNFEVSWVEKATGKVMAKGLLNKIPGVVMTNDDFDFDPAPKIKECYAKAGKMCGKKMVKALKPKKK